MLKQEEIICKNGIHQIYTYSDSNYYIRQIETDLLYAEAYDNIPVRYTYEETDIPIDPEPEPEPNEEE